MIIERVDTHGLTLWLPAMPDATSAEVARQIVSEIVAAATDANEVLQSLSVHGFDLRLNVEFHGPQDFQRWAVAARPGTWADARLREAVA